MASFHNDKNNIGSGNTHRSGSLADSHPNTNGSIRVPVGVHPRTGMRGTMTGNSGNVRRDRRGSNPINMAFDGLSLSSSASTSTSKLNYPQYQKSNQPRGYSSAFSNGHGNSGRHVASTSLTDPFAQFNPLRSQTQAHANDVKRDMQATGIRRFSGIDPNAIKNLSPASFSSSASLKL